MIVVDSSIVYKWFISEDEKSTSVARKLLEDYIKKRERFIVPDILLYEFANILSYKTSLEKGDIHKIWQKFIKIDLPLFIPNFSFIQKCLLFSKRHRVSIYDASYAVLAQEKACNLITADHKFVDQVNLPFVKSLVS